MLKRKHKVCPWNSKWVDASFFFNFTISQFNNSCLQVEKNYVTKIVNTCLFGVANMVKNGHKHKYLCSGYEVTFDIAGLWNFGKALSRNVVILGIDNKWIT